jgi:anthranilate/para-aminobenzoate synthase component II
MINVYIFDFNDSFTFNIANRLNDLSLSHKVIKQKDHKSTLDKVLKIKRRKICLIFGPGPGHPDDYHEVADYLDRLMKQQNLLLWGICLGHQILMKQLGFNILRIKPNHGVPIKLKWHKKSILVQQYNSLAVKYNPAIELKGKILHYKGIVWGFEGPRVVSWQFHPESVGTSCPLKFFSSLPKFLYNSKDASKTSNQDRRHLLSRYP